MQVKIQDKNKDEDKLFVDLMTEEQKVKGIIRILSTVYLLQ